MQNGIKHCCHPYNVTTSRIVEDDHTCVLYQKDLHAGDFGGLNVDLVDIRQNNAASQSVLDIHIFDHEDDLQYVFDYSASRYDQQTMTEFQKLFKRVIAAIVHNANNEGYQFSNLMNDLCGKKGFVHKIKEIFSRK